MKWTNSYRSFGLKTKRSTGLKTIEHKHLDTPARAWRLAGRNRSGRIQNGALRRLGDGAVAGPSIYPAMSCAETLESEEPGELKGAERK